VAPNGNDANPGTAARPFATLERARDAARQSRIQRPLDQVQVVVRGGTYQLKQPLALGPQDSGLVIEAAKGEEAVISGGRVVGGWRPWRGRILQADLSALDLPDCKFRELYYQGRRQSLARVPNFDPQHPRLGGVLFNERLIEPGTKTRFGYRTGELDPAKWTHPERAWMVFHDSLNYEQTWAALKSVDPANRVLEAARALRKLELKPKRTIRFVLFSGEEQGLVGSRMYVEAHKAELSKFSGILVHDTGTGRVMSIGAQGNYAVREVLDQVVAPLRSVGLVEPSLRSTRGTDHASFADAGVPGFYCIQDPAEYRKTHHTQSDTFDKVWKDDLVQGAKVLAVWAYNVAQLPELLPRPAARAQQTAGQE